MSPLFQILGALPAAFPRWGNRSPKERRILHPDQETQAQRDARLCPESQTWEESPRLLVVTSLLGLPCGSLGRRPER